MVSWQEKIGTVNPTLKQQHSRQYIGMGAPFKRLRVSPLSVRMEIICVGNELLIGKTLNTNAHWIAGEATSLGLSVQRVTVVSDDVDEIAAVVQEALSRRPRFIVMTGGLGPTFDDKTLQGIAKGMGRRLEVNQKALGMIRSKYEALLRTGKIERVEMTPSREKMARFPKETEPLHNPVGTAPGMLANVEGACLIALPGVPPEMQAIFSESVKNMFKKEAGETVFVESSIYADHIIESSLAPLIDQVMSHNPSVYIKSHVYTKAHPSAEGQKSHIELHFSTRSADLEAGKNCVEKAVAQMRELVEKNGGRISIK